MYSLLKSKSLYSLGAVIIFGTLPSLALYASNAELFKLHQLVYPLIFSAIISLTIFAFLVFLIRDYLKASVAAIVFQIFFWYYGLIHDGLFIVFKLEQWHTFPIILFAYYTVIVYIKRLNNIGRWFFSLVIPVVVLFLFNVINISLVELDKRETSPSQRKDYQFNINFSEDFLLPDIYLIILDEYASNSVIKEEWGYDNSEFITFLRDKGFYMPEYSRVRYSQTLRHMTSLFNLDYLTPPVKKNDWHDYTYFPERIRGTKVYQMLQNYSLSTNEIIELWNDNLLFRILKEYGYNIAVLEGISQHYPSFRLNDADTIISYMDAVNTYSPRMYVNPFFSELRNKSIMSFFEVFKKPVQIRNMSYVGTEHFLNILRRDDINFRSPKFFYVHFMCPHNPYVFDRSGNFVLPIRGVEKSKQRDGVLISENNTLNEAYLDQYIFITNEIKDIINHIISVDLKNNTIIMIQSDHGPRPHELFLKNKNNAFHVLNATYFPDRDYQALHDSISPINTLRVLLNQYFYKNFEMLEER